MAEPQNRGKKKDKGKKKISFDSSTKAPKPEAKLEPKPVKDEETPWQVFSQHPLVRVLPFFLVFLALYKSFFFLVLKRPDLLATASFGAVNLRPAVTMTDERQLLILGSMSSGTSQTTADLHDHLKLEIAHEISNTETDFTRDGTVSWFHFIRYLQPPEDKRTKFLALGKICTNHTANMGFHPRMYRASPKCSTFKKWSKCWAKECYSVLVNEWGCGFDQTCETPFASTLHQIRHPLLTTASLVVKFCKGGINGTVQPSFSKYMSALLPEREWDSLSCIESAAQYVVDYNTILLDAGEAGLLDGMYKVEESSPCDIARMAGLMDKNTTVYAPNFDRITKMCDITEGSESAQKVMVSNRRTNVNKGRVTLTWDDLRGGQHGSQKSEGDTSLEEQLKALTVKLGYSLNDGIKSPTGSESHDTEF